MKIPKEYALIIIAGLFLLGYVLDAVTNPLDVPLNSPYAFFGSEYISVYPFTTASILIKSIALFWTPLWLFSFMEKNWTAKGGILLFLAGMMQLYALQEVKTEPLARQIPLEWSLSLSFAGAALLLPTVTFFIKSALVSTHRSLSNARMQEAIAEAKKKEQQDETT